MKYIAIFNRLNRIVSGEWDGHDVEWMAIILREVINQRQTIREERDYLKRQLDEALTDSANIDRYYAMALDELATAHRSADAWHRLARLYRAAALDVSTDTRYTLLGAPIQAARVVEPEPDDVKRCEICGHPLPEISGTNERTFPDLCEWCADEITAQDQAASIQAVQITAPEPDEQAVYGEDYARVGMMCARNGGA